MKKIVLNIVVLALGYSCSKESLQHQQMGNIKNTSENDNQKIIDRIVGFKALMEDNNLKFDKSGSTSLSVTDVVWELEAEANFTNRPVNEEVNMIEKDTMTLELVKESDGRVKIPTIREGHRIIKKEVLGLTKQDRFLVVLDVEIKNETANTVTLEIVSNIGYRVILGQFTSSWFWGGGQGKYGTQSGMQPLDAADIIPSSILTVIANNQVITDVSSSSYGWWYLLAFPVTNPFGYDNNLLFHTNGSGSTIPPICMSPKY